MSFKVGQFVFARMGSYPPWPSQVSDLNEVPKGIRKLVTPLEGETLVFFFGSNNYLNIPNNCIYDWDTHVNEYKDPPKPKNTKMFQAAMKEAMGEMEGSSIEDSSEEDSDVSSEGESSSEEDTGPSLNTINVDDIPSTSDRQPKQLTEKEKKKLERERKREESIRKKTEERYTKLEERNRKKEERRKEREEEKRRLALLDPSDGPGIPSGMTSSAGRKKGRPKDEKMEKIEKKERKRSDKPTPSVNNAGGPGIILPERKRGRPSKKSLEERAALAAALSAPTTPSSTSHNPPFSSNQNQNASSVTSDNNTPSTPLTNGSSTSNGTSNGASSGVFNHKKMLKRKLIEEHENDERKRLKAKEEEEREKERLLKLEKEKELQRAKEEKPDVQMNNFEDVWSPNPSGSSSQMGNSNTADGEDSASDISSPLGVRHGQNQRKRWNSTAIVSAVERITRHPISKYHKYQVVSYTEGNALAKAFFSDARNTKFETHSNIGSAHYLLDITSYLAILTSLHEGDTAITQNISCTVVSQIPPGSEVTLKAKILYQKENLVFIDCDAIYNSKLAITARIIKSLTDPYACGITREKDSSGS